MSRRALLAAAGVAAASVAGCVGGGSGDSGVTLQPLSVYGYGGGQVMANNSETVTVSETEPNDRRAEAMSVSLGTTVEGRLERADTDWFAFDAESGQTVVAEFDRSPSDGVSSVILYGPGGDYQDLVFVGTDDPARVVETVAATGTHFVEVVDVQRSKGDYTLSLTTDSESSTPAATETQTATATPTATDTETQTATATPTATDTETQTATATPTATPLEDDYGTQAYGEYGYGGVDA